jgi:hypothetical protein
MPLPNAFAPQSEIQAWVNDRMTRPDWGQPLMAAWQSYKRLHMTPYVVLVGAAMRDATPEQEDMR